MRDAVRLQLFVGPAVPVPAPREVVEAVEAVTVRAGAGGTQDGFELAFRVSNRSPLHTMFLLTGGASIPILRVVIAVTVGGDSTVLVDGVMTHHEVSSDGGPTSTLTVRGKDLTAVMDVVPLDGLPYPAMPASVRVLAALAKYAALGIVPLVIPSIIPDLPIPIDRIPRHQGTDRAYITALATEAGYVFHLDPGPVPGVSRAYWGPEIRVGAPQKALDAALDGPHRNVDRLSFRFDKEAKELPVVMIQEPASKAPIPVPIPDVTPLNPPLGVVPPLPPRITMLNDTAKLDPAAAAMTGLAHASRHGDSVFGDGTLDVVRYGRVLRPRRLVGVRGAGEAFDGLHYVTSVTSTLRRGSFTQSFSLARNALLSTTPKVPT
ncbi:hypothetical protein [Salsipaludibacter albus]|uniref:hypothetical protein n=1 Tax=Salsipaludibacter albus TaxID=2849650 RepID=UPI001EE3B07E|nr:hypothetical protein [Salsipaludibacter albus]MBY5164283.1 hypothetical protein [Salsipaludibacter albus]